MAANDANTRYWLCMQNDEDDRANACEIVLAPGEDGSKETLCRHVLYQLGVRDPAVFNIQQVVAVKVAGGKPEITTVLDGKDLSRYVRQNYC